ncbi:MAG: molybdopterin molybdotransferase MoeA [Bacteroidota bacterium]
MIEVSEARGIIASHVRDFGTEKVALGAALGRVLREDLVADRDFPPFDRVTMDGIAIKFDNYLRGLRTFQVAGIAPAGAPQQQAVSGEVCLEVMTGAILPVGLDTVIPYEKIAIADGKATLDTDEVVAGMNIHRQGSDRQKQTTIVGAGRIISPAEIGVASTVGNAQLAVSCLPKTLIISSGDELVEVEETPAAHQIRQSNVYQIKSVLSTFGIKADRAHLTDDYDLIVKKLEGFVNDYDLIALSGGVSKGKFDWIPKALDAVGVTKHFHKIKQRPGKPFWFGSVADDTTIFAFPGNPVSSFMCLQQYLLPWLRSCLQLPGEPSKWATLGEDIDFKPDLTYFLQVSIGYSPQEGLVAMPINTNGSGDLASLVDADAFVELPRGKDTFKKGETYPIKFYR